MKRNSTILTLIMGAALALSACGDDPAEQCEELFRAICQKLSTCVGADFNQCFEDGANSPPACSEADGVSSSYDQCLSDVEGATCDAVQANPNQLPASCVNVIEFD